MVPSVYIVPSTYRDMTKLLMILYVCLLSSLPYNDGQSPLRPLQLLSFLPYPDPEAQPPWTEGPTLTLAAQLAVDIINNRTDILTGYNFELVSGDSGCTDLLNKIELSLFQQLLYSDENVAGIVGPACSHSTYRLSSQLAHRELDTIAVHIAGSHDLQDRQLYPNSFSTIDSTDVLAETVLKIIDKNNWESVFVIHDAHREFYTSIFNQLREREPNKVSFFTRVLHASTFYLSSLSVAVGECERSHRIIIFLAPPEFIANTLCRFYWEQRDFFYPNYQYIIVSQTLDEVVRNATYQNDTHTQTCSADEIQSRLQGAVFIHYRLDPFNSSEATDFGLSYKQFIDLYTRSVDAYNMELEDGEEMIQPSFWAASYFDAVWSLALALNNSREEVKNSTGLDLSEYRYGHSAATNIIRNNLLQLDFEGVSGRIRFNASTGFTRHLVDIYQAEDNHMKRLEYYNISDNSIGNYSSEGVEFIDDNFIIITDDVITVGVFIVILLVIIVIMLAFLQILSILFANHRSIKATSPNLYHCAYGGCYLTALAAFLITVANSFNVPPAERCRLQHAAIVIEQTGDVLLFASLTAISFRIYRIFVHYMHPGRFVSDVYLLAFVAIVTAIFILISVITAAFVKSEEMLECCESQADYMLVKVRCTYSFEYWQVPTLAFPVVLTLSASAFALMSAGKVTMKEFKTTFIVVLCYLLYFSTGIWMLTYLNTPDSGSLSFIPRVASHIAFLCFCLVLLFFPPTLPILKNMYNSHLKRYVVSFRCCQTNTEKSDSEQNDDSNKVDKDVHSNQHDEHYVDSDVLNEQVDPTHGHVMYSNKVRQRFNDVETKDHLTNRVTSKVRITIEVFEDTVIPSNKSNDSLASVEANNVGDVTRVSVIVTDDPD